MVGLYCDMIRRAYCIVTRLTYDTESSLYVGGLTPEFAFPAVFVQGASSHYNPSDIYLHSDTAMSPGIPNELN